MTEELERRVTDLERSVADLRGQLDETASDAAAARVLSAGADHDVSEVRAELRAHTRALSALRQTQLEQGQRLDSLEDKVDRGFAQVDRNFAQVDRGFAQVDRNFAQVDVNFGRVAQDLATVHDGVQQILGLLSQDGS